MTINESIRLLSEELRRKKGHQFINIVRFLSFREVKLMCLPSGLLDTLSDVPSHRFLMHEWSVSRWNSEVMLYSAMRIYLQRRFVAMRPVLQVRILLSHVSAPLISPSIQ